MKFTNAEFDAVARAAIKGLKGFAPPPHLNLAQWARKHFKLVKESSYVEQDWEPYPFQPGIMILMSDYRVVKLSFKKSARVGYTKMLVAAMLYFAQHLRRNQCVWQPIETDRDEFVKTEINPALRDVEIMQSCLPTRGTKRDSNNTLGLKTFAGSVLYTKPGKSAGEYRRISIDCGYLDEIDKFDRDIEGEGDCYALAWKRFEGSTFPKLIAGSTPKTKGLSHIDSLYQEADIRLKFFVPCPECSHEHVLLDPRDKSPARMRWEIGRPDTVKHYCPGCGVGYTQSQFLRTYKRGRWKTEDENFWLDEKAEELCDAQGNVVPMPSNVAVHIWSAYSPQAKWVEIATEYDKAVAAKADGRHEPMKTHVNTTLGDVYEDEHEKADVEVLKGRTHELRIGAVPEWASVLVAGVDTQDDRWEVVVWAFGRGEQMAAIDYKVIYGDPADMRDWEKLDKFLLQGFRTSLGKSKSLDRVAIDTGGHYTHEAYRFCRLRWGRRVLAIRGDSQPGKPIFSSMSFKDVNHMGRILKRGVRLYSVGTDTAKDLLHARFKLEGDGPGRVHFAQGLPDEFFDQMAAESRVLQKTARGEVYRWEKTELRNETLDCTVYALFCAAQMGLDAWTEPQWRQQERKLLTLPAFVPAEGQADLPASPPALASKTTSPKRKPNTAPAPMPAQTNPPKRRTSRFASEEWLARN